MNPPPRPGAVMTRGEIDHAYAQLEAIRDRIADTLVSRIEGHRGYRYLSDHQVTGRTLEVLRRLGPSIALVAAQYKVLDDKVREARQARERRDRIGGNARLVELTRLLRDPLVALSTDGVPMDAGADPAAETVSLATLCHRLDESCAGIEETLGRIAAESDAVTARLAALASGLSRARSRAATLGVRQEPDYESLVTTFTELSALAVNDPLGCSGDPAAAAGTLDARLRRLEADLDTATRRLEELHALAQAYPQRIASLRSFVAAVAAAEEATEVAYAMVGHKIAKFQLPPHVARRNGLLTGLATIERYERARRWPDIAERLPELERAAEAALADARAHAAEANAPLADRDELRGRLDGYRARADRLGISERAALADAYRTARDLVWTAPCDLVASAAAVWRYQELVADPPTEDGDSRS